MKEYEADELADDEADEKRISKALKAAEKRADAQVAKKKIQRMKSVNNNRGVTQSHGRQTPYSRPAVGYQTGASGSRSMPGMRAARSPMLGSCFACNEYGIRGREVGTVNILFIDETHNVILYNMAVGSTILDYSSLFCWSLVLKLLVFVMFFLFLYLYFSIHLDVNENPLKVKYSLITILNRSFCCVLYSELVAKHSVQVEFVDVHFIRSVFNLSSGSWLEVCSMEFLICFSINTSIAMNS